jgi:hypothetical protein
MLLVHELASASLFFKIKWQEQKQEEQKQEEQGGQTFHVQFHLVGVFI